MSDFRMNYVHFATSGNECLDCVHCIMKSEDCTKIFGCNEGPRKLSPCQSLRVF